MGRNDGVLKMKTMTYREDDWVAEVEVVENNSDEQWDKFKLKVVKTIQPSQIYKPTKDGTVFDVSARKNAGCCGGMWSLDDY